MYIPPAEGPHGNSYAPGWPIAHVEAGPANDIIFVAFAWPHDRVYLELMDVELSHCVDISTYFPYNIVSLSY